MECNSRAPLEGTRSQCCLPFGLPPPRSSTCATLKPPENDQKNITELCDKFEESINHQPKTLAVTDLSLADVMQLLVSPMRPMDGNAIGIAIGIAIASIVLAAFETEWSIVAAQTLWNIPPSEMMDLPDSMGQFSFSSIQSCIKVLARTGN